MSRPWFISWFNFVRFIASGCIYCFIGCLWFLCFLSCVNLLFFWNRMSDGFLHHITFCFPFFPTMSVVPSLTTVSVIVTNSFLVLSKYPLIFLTFSLGLLYILEMGHWYFKTWFQCLIFSNRLTLESVPVFNSSAKN